MKSGNSLAMVLQEREVDVCRAACRSCLGTGRVRMPTPNQAGTSRRDCVQPKTHGNGAQVGKLGRCVAARGPRADLGVFQLADGRGLLEVSDDLGIFENVFAIKAEGRLQRARRARPPTRGLSTPVKWPSGSRALGRASASSDAAIISSRLRSARTSSAYLKLSTSPCSVMRNWPSKAVHGLGEDGAMRGPATAADGAAAAVEEAQLDAGLARHHVQIAMRAEDLPGAGEHAAVFVGVGVAEHDLLPVVPGGEQLAIVGAAPELAANGGRIAQVVDGFEERDRHQAGICRSVARLRP